MLKAEELYKLLDYYEQNILDKILTFNFTVVFKHTVNVFIIFNACLNMNNSVFVIGLIVLILGLAAGFYTALGDFKQYSVFLIVVSVIILIIGALVPSVKTVTTHRETVIPEKRTKVVVRED